MKYSEFERVVSKPRMSRYMNACSNDTRKAMLLYRYNLILSRELFTIVSCLEIALRNEINTHYISVHGNDWLRDAISVNGFFCTHKCQGTSDIARRGLRRLRNNYSHDKLIAEMDFGFWRYLFAKPQFSAAGKSLLNIFPGKPRTTPLIQYNNTYVFRDLGQLNGIRNRIAHHEPICFNSKLNTIDTSFAQESYYISLELLRWMQIDTTALLYGIDHVNQTLQKVNKFAV